MNDPLTQLQSSAGVSFDTILSTILRKRKWMILGSSSAIPIAGRVRRLQAAQGLRGDRDHRHRLVRAAIPRLQLQGRRRDRVELVERAGDAADRAARLQSHVAGARRRQGAVRPRRCPPAPRARATAAGLRLRRSAELVRCASRRSRGRSCASSRQRVARRQLTVTSTTTRTLAALIANTLAQSLHRAQPRAAPLAVRGRGHLARRRVRRPATQLNEAEQRAHRLQEEEQRRRRRPRGSAERSLDRREALRRAQRASRSS